MILCHCAGVSDRTIERLIVEEGASSLADVARRCGAGRSCAPCRDEIVDMLYRLRTAAHNAAVAEETQAPRREAA